MSQPVGWGVLGAVLAGALTGVAQAEPEAEVTAAVVPLDLSHYWGRHDDRHDAKIDSSALAAAGGSIALSIGSDRYEVRSRLEYVTPIAPDPDLYYRVHQLRAVVGGNLLVGGPTRVSLGFEAGVSQFRYDGGVATGYTLGPVVGLRRRLSPRVTLLLELTATRDVAEHTAGDGNYRQELTRVGKLAIGASYAL